MLDIGKQAYAGDRADQQRGITMRKLVASLFMSLDGVVQGPGPGDDFELAGWTMPYWDDDIGAFIQAGMMASDALLLGRATYQGFASAFGSDTSPDAQFMNSVRKYVVSTTLREATWNNSSLINGNVVEEIASLKQQPGRDIAISGSGTLVQSLLPHKLIDELNLLIYPVVLGRGKRLFEDASNLGFKLTHSQASGSGVLLLTYQVA
jgi:dihydrofolate reductase